MSDSIDLQEAYMSPVWGCLKQKLLMIADIYNWWRYATDSSAGN